MGKGKEKNKIHWHPAFFKAIQLELFDYLDILDFKYEHQITTEPLRMDLLIIKKRKECSIDKNIARIFKSDNIFEYKSPEDSLSDKDFLKVSAYGNLHPLVNPDVKASDISLTFIANKQPREFLKYLTKEQHFKAEKFAPGIHHVYGYYLPIQVIEQKKLSETENLWLKSLRSGLELKTFDTIIEKSIKRAKILSLDAYLDVLFRANSKFFLEAQNMTNSTITIEEVFTKSGIISSWIEQVKLEGIQEGEQKGRLEGERKAEQRIAELLRNGKSPEEIIQEYGS